MEPKDDDSVNVLFDMFYENKHNIEEAIRRISKRNRGLISIMERVERQNRVVILFKDHEDCNMFKIEIKKYAQKF